MHKTSLRLKLLLTSSFLVLSSCSHPHIQRTDSEVCGDLGALGAHCHHTLATDTRDIAKPQWDALRQGWLCMSSQDFSSTEDAIDEACIWIQCNYVQKQAIKAIMSRPIVENETSGLK